MGGLKPYWIYPSCYQNHRVFLVVAAAALPESHVRCAGLGGEGAGLSNSRQGMSDQEGWAAA